MSRTYIPIALDRRVRDRASGQCEYCRSLSKYSTASFALDHIVPVSTGGLTDEQNLALSCVGCNTYKSAFVNGQDPVTGRIAPLYNPRLQRWADHFTWSDDALRIIGITASGRATVARLRLNRTALVYLRAALVSHGVHPPD